MADVFISYSNPDRETARLVAAFLETQGFSTWWDHNLLAGDQFRKAIMTELGKARAVVVIWTENSIHSDWVQSEAGRAHADQKLVSTKHRLIEYRDIPPPFDNLHTEAVDNLENIGGAITALLAKPSAAPSLYKVLRYQFWSWFGIIGATITFVSNMSAFARLATWARFLTDNWVAGITYFWSKILFFLPSVPKTDAIVLTFFSFITSNAIFAVRRGGSGKSSILKLSSASILLFGMFVAAIFAQQGLDKDRLSQSIRFQQYAVTVESFIFDAIWSAGLAGNRTEYLLGPIKMRVVAQEGKRYLLFQDGDIISTLIFVASVPTLMLAVAFVTLIWMLSFLMKQVGGTVSTRKFANRLWTIIACICGLMLLNQSSVWLEGQLWAKELLR